MKRIAIMVVLSLFYAMSADADTYTWTDKNGVANFTDDLGMIPTAYRRKAIKREDITINNPKVQQELREQAERARQEKTDGQRKSPSADRTPPPSPPVIVAPKPSPDDLPPGRTKSQRIRDNIERREAEEKAK